MGFTEIREILEYFNIHTSNIDEIQHIIKDIRNSTHPDTTGGDFVDNTQKEKHLKAKQALDFLSEKRENSQLQVLDKLTELLAVTAKILPDHSSAQVAANVESRYNEAVNRAFSENYIPRISFTALSAVMTFLVAIPNKIEESHFFSARINTNSLAFVVIWLSMLIYTGAFWFMAYRNKERTKERLSNLKAEIIQNNLFRNFALGKESFAKDELVRFIHDQYGGRRESLFLFGGKSITLEYAQAIGDSIVNRLLKNKIIKLNNSLQLSEEYNVIYPKLV